MLRGKYAAVLEKLQLPRFTGSISTTEPKQREKIDAVKAAMSKEHRCDALTLAHKYAELRRLKLAFDKREKELNLEIQACTELMIEAFEAEDVSNIRMTDNAAVRVEAQPYARVTDRDQHRAWAIETGLERSLVLPWQTTNAITKNALVRGLEPPPGIGLWQRMKAVFAKGDEDHNIQFGESDWQAIARHIDEKYDALILIDGEDDAQPF